MASDSENTEKLKPIGICPHCKNNVRAKIIEECTFTRDICECPECSEKILRCRAPGCNNYTEYDDFFNELCPSCSQSTPRFIGNVAKGAVGIALAGVTMFTKLELHKKK